MGSTSHQTLSAVRGANDHQALSSVEVIPGTTLQPGAVQGLIFDPRAEVDDAGRILLRGRSDHGGFAWGFWLAVLSLVGMAAVFTTTGTFGFWSSVETFLLAGLLTVGVLGYKFGKTSTLVDVELGSISTFDHRLRLGNSSFPFEEITEVVFAMTSSKVKPGRGPKVTAFTLLIRHNDSDLFPVVEASPQKAALFELAKLLSAQLGAPIAQVGDGYTETPH